MYMPELCRYLVGRSCAHTTSTPKLVRWVHLQMTTSASSSCDMSSHPTVLQFPRPLSALKFHDTHTGLDQFWGTYVHTNMWIRMLNNRDHNELLCATILNSVNSWWRSCLRYEKHWEVWIAIFMCQMQYAQVKEEYVHQYKFNRLMLLLTPNNGTTYISHSLSHGQHW